MQAYQILDTRDFMKKLLLSETFDTFLLSEASITTFATFHINGTFHPEYLHDSELETAPPEKSGFTLWKRVRPFFLELTKGKNTPLNFRIVFRLAPHNIQALLLKEGIRMKPEEIDGLFLNIHYEGSSVNCVSGTSLRTFSLDKSLEHAWDSMLQKFFRQKEIPFC